MNSAKPPYGPNPGQRTLVPGAGCEAVLAPNIAAYCVVTTSSAKVRAALVLFNRTTSALQVEIPATK
jgi:hypothetical protein